MILILKNSLHAAQPSLFTLTPSFPTIAPHLLANPSRPKLLSLPSPCTKEQLSLPLDLQVALLPSSRQPYSSTQGNSSLTLTSFGPRRTSSSYLSNRDQPSTSLSNELPHVLSWFIQPELLFTPSPPNTAKRRQLSHPALRQTTPLPIFSTPETKAWLLFTSSASPLGSSTDVLLPNQRPKQGQQPTSSSRKGDITQGSSSHLSTSFGWKKSYTRQPTLPLWSEDICSSCPSCSSYLSLSIDSCSIFQGCLRELLLISSIQSGQLSCQQHSFPSSSPHLRYTSPPSLAQRTTHN